MRTHIIRWLGLAAAVGTLCLASCGDETAAEVRAVYDRYNTALRDKDGDAFLQTIDPENVKHYDQYVAMAQRGTKEQLKAVNSMGRNYVILLRHRLKPEELKKLDGAEFVRICVQRGWFFMESEDERFTLGHITVKPPRATAELRINGERTGDHLGFVLLDGRWLVNDEGLDRVFEKDLAKAARKLHTPEDELLMDKEADESGQEVDPKILDEPPQLDGPPPPETAPKPKKKPKKG